MKDEGLRLWLVRHGRTAANAEGWMQGRTDVPLNEAGIADARLLAERMTLVPLRAVYTSPLSRAHETATIVAERAKLDARVLDDLSEIDMGAYERRPVSDILAGNDGERERWAFGPDRAALGGRESIADLVVRAQRVLETIVAENPAGDVCVVAHAGILLATIAVALDLSDGTFLPPIALGNSSISRLEHRLGRWLLGVANDQSHLSAPALDSGDLLLTLFGRPDAVHPMRTIR